MQGKANIRRQYAERRRRPHGPIRAKNIISPAVIR
jgi:hypothetical protein